MDAQPERSVPAIVRFLSSTALQVVFSLLALGLTLFYNVAYYIYVPFTGVWLDYANPERNTAIVATLDEGGPGEKAGLQSGDRIITIDGRLISNLNIPIHQPKRTGDIELYRIERGPVTLEIPVKVGSYFDDPGSLVDILPIQLLSLLISLCGLTLLFFSPPSDLRARLISIGWMLAGVALATTGPGYTGCIWLAPNVAVLTFAIASFISISAHLYFPVASFSNRTRNFIIWLTFGLSLVLVVGYLSQQAYLALHQQNPATSFTEQVIRDCFYVSLLASLGLLVKNRFLVNDTDIQRQTGIVFLGTLLSFLPFLLFSVLPTLLFGRNSTYILIPHTISILTLVFLPISYGYVIYQRKLLKVDFILNRTLVFFLLVVSILFFSFMILSGVSAIFHLPSSMAAAGSLLCVLVALPSASLKRSIQVFVDRVLYGGYYDYTTVTSELSDRLARANDRDTFITLLVHELPRKMKIARSEVLLLAGNSLENQGSSGERFSVSLSDELCTILRSQPGPTRAQAAWDLASSATLEHWKAFYWARLLIPIIHDTTLYGILVLGERVSGEFYSNQDLQILGTVGQQAALSIANVFLVETLRGLARDLVRADEEQRKKVARDLHDSVLQDLFFVKQRLARSDPDSASYVDHTIQMLRQTIKAQRTSLLDRGLTLALQDLVDAMSQLAGDGTVILWHNELDREITLSDEKATSLYRIVQEALANVLKHSQAEQAVVSARNKDGILEIRIEDDGIGMDKNDETWVGHHYGLLGMKERASMIGADMEITSQPGSGTAVSVRVKLEAQMIPA